MKFSAVATLAIAALANAQSREDIPECARPCLDEAITKNTKCSTTDFACVCQNFSAIQGQAAGCVLEKCGQEKAFNEVLPATKKLCEAVKNKPSAPASSSQAPSSSAAAPSQPASSSSAAAPSQPASSSAAAPSQPAGSSSAAAPSHTTVVSTHAPTGSAVPTTPANGTTPAQPPVSAGAAGAAGYSFAAVLVAAALL